MPAPRATASRRARGWPIAIALLAIFDLGCLHDFSVFEPVPDTDGGPGSAGGDASGGAETGPGDAAMPPGYDATPLGDASCGSDCRIEALSCAGTCAEVEQSCAAPCAQGDSACTNACLTSQNGCTSQCVTQCETCTSGEGCVDPSGCAAAAP
jgi:hypothetical protein